MADLHYYFDWYRFTEKSRIRFARMRLIGSVRIYWTSVEREYTRRMKQKLKKKYLIDSYKHCFLDKLHNLCQGSRSVQDYTIEFNDLTYVVMCKKTPTKVYLVWVESDIKRSMFIHSHKIETLEQASQLAQDRKTSLSSECRVIPKARRATYPIHSYTTREPKGNPVISKSFKNAKGNQCFKCQEYDHIVAQCPSRNILIKEDDGNEIETIVYAPTGSATDSNDDVRISSIQLGVVRCSHIAVNNED